MWTVYAKDHQDADIRDLQSLKDFMKDVAMGIDGEAADPDAGADSEIEDHAGEGTVLQYWKKSTRALFRENDPVDKIITNSVRQIKTKLQKECPMAKVKRPRRFGTRVD